VELTSSKEEASGVVVPIPAAPVAGNVFVCACTEAVVITARKRRIIVFIKRIVK
jgi:hypothetical protein